MASENCPKRIFVEKKEGFRTAAESLRKELNQRLGISLNELRLFCVYDIFGMSDSLFDASKYKIFAEPAVDNLSLNPDLSGFATIAIEPLPGQFDQRAASAVDCVRLISPDAKVEIISSQLIAIPSDTPREIYDKIVNYSLNPVESRLKDLSLISLPVHPKADKVDVIDGFIEINKDSAPEIVKRYSLAMSNEDLLCAVEYFKNEKRNPTMTELRILDTYWSDHCRHTTFNTALKNIEIGEGELKSTIEDILKEWEALRKETKRDTRAMTLMDLATIAAKTLRSRGLTPDVEVSDEINACSIFIDVDIEKEGTISKEKWLLQFKNETHNHPTEIEPFGGASTCLGGAIRDPLSGRSYVYQAMRITGAADPTADISTTLSGKLPQSTISRKAAAGYSSYGNQFGIATTHVREIFHPGYVAKRMEVGAVVGAVAAENIQRLKPENGDVIIMLGGATGRDGIGGATGSSKKHDDSSLTTCGSEVQKGNAPEERKIARLFRRPEVTRIIKKSNDFGAGGVSVAIGELADGLDIYLDRVPLKYAGLNPTEIAISESQERMAVVVAREDVEKFMELCAEENINAIHVADVTDTNRMKLFFGDEIVADLRRDFIDSAGAARRTTAVVNTKADTERIFRREPVAVTENARFIENLKDPNVSSQKGLSEMFDASIGASTVLMPFGGKRQLTESQVSAQTIPVAGSHTVSVMSYGFNPTLTESNPTIGAAYACVESLGRLAASGARWQSARFSFQEYFEKMSSPQAWGKPLAALLGALRMQMAFEIPAIGGKDSMSGTFNDINVPPTLISFAVTTADINNVISPEFKAPGRNIYLARHTPLPSGMPDTDSLKSIFNNVERGIQDGVIDAAWALGFGGLAEGLAKMSFGNNIGAEISIDVNEDFNRFLYDLNYGSILLTSTEKLDNDNFIYLGTTIDNPSIIIKDSKGKQVVDAQISELLSATREYFKNLYPEKTEICGEVRNADSGTHKEIEDYRGGIVEKPLVAIPVFPGTNCDYDIANAFKREGARTEFCVFRNLTPEDIEQSAHDLATLIDRCHILALSGGFSAGDEPDGSGKFIANVLCNAEVKGAIERLIERQGLVLGICNGFQALVKSGLLPFGKIGENNQDSPTLFTNDINRHISQIVYTRVGSIKSPWLSSFHTGDIHAVAASHGEGKFMVSNKKAMELMEAGQIAFQYADNEGNATMCSPQNPNGSVMAIEGIISPDGRILGKMAHSERWNKGLMKNISGNRDQNIFRNAVNYFKTKH